MMRKSLKHKYIIAKVNMSMNENTQWGTFTNDQPFQFLFLFQLNPERGYKSWAECNIHTKRRIINVYDFHWITIIKSCTFVLLRLYIGNGIFIQSFQVSYYYIVGGGLGWNWELEGVVVGPNIVTLMKI